MGIHPRSRIVVLIVVDRERLEVLGIPPDLLNNFPSNGCSPALHRARPSTVPSLSCSKLATVFYYLGTLTPS